MRSPQPYAASGTFPYRTKRERPEGGPIVPNARSTELLADIEPSPTTKSNASSAHTNLRAHLRGHKDFADLWRDDFLAGSYSRDTAIRPRKTEDGHERSDVDIIVVGDYRTTDDPEGVLFHLADVIGDEYDVERINKRSVRAVDGSTKKERKCG